METKHTTGKWIKQKTTFGGDGELRGIAILSETAAPIAYAIINKHIPNGEASANAKLIAAAPKLLEALEETTNTLKFLAEHLTEAGKGELQKALLIIQTATT